MTIKPFGIAAMTVAASVFASPSAQAVSYHVKTDLQCGISPTGPPYGVVVLNLIPPNGGMTFTTIPQGRKIYFKAFGGSGSKVLPHPLPPGWGFNVGTVRKYTFKCYAWHFVCKPPF